MRTLLKFRVGPTLLCLVNILLAGKFFRQVKEFRAIE